jgi:hypothetical protein
MAIDRIDQTGSCQTAPVAITKYPDFYVAAAAAAPVVALANQVVLSDSFGLRLLFRRAKKDSTGAVKSHASRGYNFAFWLFFLGYSNLVFQTGVLVGSLAILSPLHGVIANPTPGLAVTLIVVPAGVLLLLATSILSGYVRDEATQLEAAQLEAARLEAAARSLPAATEGAVATIAATLREMLHGPAPDE